MIKRIFIILLSVFYLSTFGQETFPVNGVATEFEPIYAFINAHIVSSDKEIKNWLPAELGSLEVGKKADMIILDQNLLEIPLQDIAKTQVLTTIFSGEIIYEQSALK